MGGETMKYFRFIIIFSFITFTRSLFANECSFSANGQGIPTMNSGGASISTHFSSHLTNQNQEIMALLEGAESLDGFRASIDEYIAQPDNAARIREERSDVALILQSVESGRLQWLGLEVSPGELSNGTPYEAMVADYTGLRGTFSEILTPEQTDAVMHLMYSPDIIARATNPEAFRSIRNVALDDTEQKELAGDYIDMMDEGYDSLIDLGMAGHMTPDQYVAFRDYVNSGFKNNRRFTDEEIDTYVARFEHPGVRSLFIQTFTYLTHS